VPTVRRVIGSSSGEDGFSGWRGGEQGVRFGGVPQWERVFDVHAELAVVDELGEVFEFGAVRFHGDAGESATGGDGPVGEGGVGALDGRDQKAARAEHGDGPGAVVAADQLQDDIHVADLFGEVHLVVVDDVVGA